MAVRITVQFMCARAIAGHLNLGEGRADFTEPQVRNLFTHAMIRKEFDSVIHNRNR